MITHPKDLVVDIVSIETDDCGYSHEEHEIWHDHALVKCTFSSFSFFDMLALHITIAVNIVIKIYFILIILSLIFCSCMLHAIFCRCKLGLQERRKLHWQLIGWWAVLMVVELALFLGTLSSIWTNMMVSCCRWQMLTSKYSRQKVYKNHGFAKVVLILSVMIQKKQKKHSSNQHHQKKKRKKEATTSGKNW